MAGRCGGGAARKAGAAGRAIAGGGPGRAMAAGGAAGRAMAAGGAAGRAPAAPGPNLRSWADAPTLAAIAETPTRSAAKQTTRGSIIVAPRWFWSPTTFNAQTPRSFAWRRMRVLRSCAAGREVSASRQRNQRPQEQCQNRRRSSAVAVCRARPSREIPRQGGTDPLQRPVDLIARDHQRRGKTDRVLMGILGQNALAL